MKVEAFDHIVLNVRDVEVSAAWYAKALAWTAGMPRPRIGRPGRA